jgi:hypothetical protein
VVWTVLDPGGERRAFGRAVDADFSGSLRLPGDRRMIVAGWAVARSDRVGDGLLGALMRAGRRVKAIIIKHQPGHWEIIDNMRFDDLHDVFRLNIPIPDSFGIDDYRWTMFTLIKASRFIGSYSSFQPTARKFLFEGQLQAAQAFRITASTRIASRTLIGADKYMMFKFWHNSLSSKFASAFCDASSGASDLPSIAIWVTVLTFWRHLPGIFAAPSH